MGSTDALSLRIDDPDQKFTANTIEGALIELVDRVNALGSNGVPGPPGPSGLEASRSLLQIKENTGGGPLNYINFPGGVGNYVSTPNNASFNVAGDITHAVRFKMPSSAPAADLCLIGRWGANTGLSSARFFLKTTGQMAGNFTVDGTTIITTTTSAVTPLAFDGNWIWLRQSRASSTGNVSYFTAPDTGSDDIIPVTWTSFQANRTGTAGPLWSNGGLMSVPLNIGAFNDGQNNVTTGQMGRALVYAGNGTGTTPVADCNASSYIAGTSWVGVIGNVWTLFGTVTMVLAGGGAIASINTKTVLANTDAFPAQALAHYDVLYWFSPGGMINSSGSDQTFTVELVIAGVILTTFPPITLPSNAGVYRFECMLSIESAMVDGTKQMYSWTLRIYNAVTGSFVGSQQSSAVLFDIGGAFSGIPIVTLLAVPKIEMKITMGVALPTVSCGSVHARLSLQKA